MPLNDYPTAKPTYDFYDTVSAGRPGWRNGVLESVTRHAPDKQFPGGSATWHWTQRAPIASYLVEDSIGNYTLTSRTGSDASGTTRRGRVDQRGPAAEEPGHHEPAAGHHPTSRASSTGRSVHLRGIIIGTPEASSKRKCRR